MSTGGRKPPPILPLSSSYKDENYVAVRAGQEGLLWKPGSAPRKSITMLTGVYNSDTSDDSRAAFIESSALYGQEASPATRAKADASELVEEIFIHGEFTKPIVEEWLPSPSSLSTTPSFEEHKLTDCEEIRECSAEPNRFMAQSAPEEDDDFDEDTENIDFAALKGHLNVFRPEPGIDRTDCKGKYVFYSLQTGLLRHHVLAEICRRQGAGTKNLSEIMRNGPFWLDICNPTMAEVRALSDIFKMHPLTLEGLESEVEDIREKCDVFQKYYFVCIRAFDADTSSDYYMRPINLYMLVSPSCVITIHRDFLEFSHTIAKRMRLLTARTGLASDWIVYTILEDVLEMFAPSIRATELEIDSIDDLVDHFTSSKDLRRSQTELFSKISVARKRVTQLIRLMSAKSELLRIIAKRCGTRFSDDALLYLRDLQDHTAMVDQTLQHYDDSLHRSHANYLAYISLEISETSNRMSGIMKKLTAISTVTLPWTMITGLMGMNVFVPGARSYYSESWLPWLCLFLAMSSASILIYAVGRRRDWF